MSSIRVAVNLLLIVALAVAAAVVYGIVHDQVTARLCVEYFTIGHPPVFDTDSPTLLAFGWGTIATWWVGVILGIPAAMLAQLGRGPRLGPGQLLAPLGWLLATMGSLALTAGVAGWLLAAGGSIGLSGPLADAVPAGKHVAFIAVWFAHTASYAVGFVGGIVFCLWIWVQRRCLAHRAMKCAASQSPEGNADVATRRPAR